jgi:1-acyl-sn-glycerol-3-phosphate acyltransferase
MGRRRGYALEPWYQVAKIVGLSPMRLWFSWRLEGLENIPSEGPGLVACSHLSYVDPFGYAEAVIRRGRRPRFLGKAQLFDVPLVGAALHGAGQIPVNRGSGDQTPLRNAEEALAAGEVVLVYPEGTVTDRADHLPMSAKTGVVRLSLATGVPIVPMGSWGSHPVWQKSGRGSLKFGRPIWVKAGSPIDLSNRKDQADDRDALHEMTDEVMAAITVLVEDLRGRYPKRWSDDG